MTRQIEVVFEGGVFVPIEPVDWLDDHARLRVDVVAPNTHFPLEDLSWIPEISAADCDAMELAIEDAFGRTDDDEPDAQ